MLEIPKNPRCPSQQQTIAPIIAPATAQVKLRPPSHKFAGNLIYFAIPFIMIQIANAE
jgi:hypothetical protein